MLFEVPDGAEEHFQNDVFDRADLKELLAVEQWDFFGKHDDKPVLKDKKPDRFHFEQEIVLSAVPFGPFYDQRCMVGLELHACKLVRIEGGLKIVLVDIERFGKVFPFGIDGIDVHMDHRRIILGRDYLVADEPIFLKHELYAPEWNERGIRKESGSIENKKIYSTCCFRIRFFPFFNFLKNNRYPRAFTLSRACSHYFLAKTDSGTLPGSGQFFFEDRTTIKVFHLTGINGKCRTTVFFSMKEKQETELQLLAIRHIAGQFDVRIG